MYGIKITLFWDVTPSSLADGYISTKLRSGTGLDTEIFIAIALMTSVSHMVLRFLLYLNLSDLEHNEIGVEKSQTHRDS
jgi:hypothetical protein